MPRSIHGRHLLELRKKICSASRLESQREQLDNTIALVLLLPLLAQMWPIVRHLGRNGRLHYLCSQLGLEVQYFSSYEEVKNALVG